jgi:hypothetical protein
MARIQHKIVIARNLNKIIEILSVFNFTKIIENDLQKREKKPHVQFMSYTFFFVK